MSDTTHRLDQEPPNWGTCIKKQDFEMSLLRGEGQMMFLRLSNAKVDEFRDLLRRALNTLDDPPAWALILSDELEYAQQLTPPQR